MVVVRDRAHGCSVTSRHDAARGGCDRTGTDSRPLVTVSWRGIEGHIGRFRQGFAGPGRFFPARRFRVDAKNRPRLLPQTICQANGRVRRKKRQKGLEANDLHVAQAADGLVDEREGADLNRHALDPGDCLLRETCAEESSRCSSWVASSP